jgi:CHAT domain-containing protein
LSDYAISSYCSSPQDLVATEVQASSPFELFAVIEPNSIDGNVALPYTLTELDKIKSRLPSQDQLILYEQSTRLPTSLRTVLTNIRRSSCVHFGCHGCQDLKNPLESFLLLSGGKLTMSKIIQECQSSGASLAYLSACETAKGDEERPDESLTLVATMAFAGFRSVVGTMWYG